MRAPCLICAELRRIVAATGEWPPFQPHTAWRQMIVTGFEQPCGLRSHGSGWRFECSRPDETGPDDWERLVAQTGACLTDAIRFPDEAEGRRARFRTGTAAIHIERGHASNAAAEFSPDADNLSNSNSLAPLSVRLP